jgi:hypothetical protein
MWPTALTCENTCATFVRVEWSWMKQREIGMEDGTRRGMEQRQSVKRIKGHTHGFWNSDLMSGWTHTHTPHDILTGSLRRIVSVLPSLLMKIPPQTRPDSPDGNERALSGEWRVPMTQLWGTGMRTSTYTSKTWNERSPWWTHIGVVLERLG